MKFVPVAAALLGLSQAAPAIVTPRQDIQLLLICNEPEQGDCLDFQVTPDVCSNIPGEWDNNVSSLTIGTNTCTFYNNPDCDDSAGGVALSGVQDSLPTEFDNSLSSVKCNKCFLPEGCS